MWWPLKAEKGKEKDSHLQPPERNTELYQHLDLAQQDAFLTSELQNYRIKNVYFFNPQSL